MKRVGRYILNGLTALALIWVVLVCVSTFLFSSERDGDGPLLAFDYRVSEKCSYSVVLQGHLILSRAVVVAQNYTAGSNVIPRGLYGRYSRYVSWEFPGLRFDNPPMQSGAIFARYNLKIEGWLLILLGLLIPGVRLSNRLRANLRRPPFGHCPVCSYDLRASKDRCPECGTSIPTVRGNAINI